MARTWLYIKKVIRLVKELWLLFFTVNFHGFARYLWALATSIPSIFAQGGLLPASQKMIGRVYTFNVFGTPVLLDGKYWGRGTELYTRKVYFVLPDFRLEKGMTVVDLGAHIGAFTVLAARIAERVIAVDISRDFLEELHENARLNECLDKIGTVWAMVGADSGIFSDPEKMRELCGDRVPPRMRLQSIFETYKLKKIDFLKIDIEGSEFDLFARDTEWLPKVARIAMEVHKEYGDIGELSKILRDNGFRVWLVNLDQKIVPEITESAGYLFARNKHI